MTSPLKTILDREKAIADVTEHFGDQLEMMRDVVNYGTQLVPRCYESSDERLVDIVLLVALCKHAVAMLDAVEIHVSSGALLASHTSARALYEATLYCTWIMHEESDFRAKCYYVWNLRQRKMWTKRMIPDTPEYSSFQQCRDYFFPSANESKPHKKGGEPKFEEASAALASIEELLASPTYNSINATFEQLRGRQAHDPRWYEPSGVKSIRAMADKLELLPEYTIFYELLCDVVHARCFSRHVKFQDSAVVFEPIRDLEKIDFILNVTISLAFRHYKEMLQRYRPQELENFRRKYKDEWRKPFRSVKSVKYNSILQPRP